MVTNSISTKQKVHYITYVGIVPCNNFKKRTKGKIHLVTRDKKMMSCGSCKNIMKDNKVRIKL